MRRQKSPSRWLCASPLPVRDFDTTRGYELRLASTLRRAFELATDDFDRKQAADSLLGIYWRQVLNADSLSAAEQRQLIADAGSFADDVLKKEPANNDAREIKSRLVEVEARLKK